ncbi:ankyrin repeat domain-containing protein [Pelagicoccus sp. SDUM812005]|uniref:ankyrin repeat domain-containing protein n=1 Tax=Pelagicoccus sp. SDUM812005 TaxID=3041257 RepID=UPI00280E47CA|nr:ankyrin repeat domain-containing protein [Pelagicoccus sp. SDUM812005]MDQ8182659.1 ankyrin repeat domain-containing protein [Pelagicoccus sp. SDUM812005]
MRRCVCFLLAMGLVGSVCAAPEKARVLFLAGEPSHGWNEHEFPAGCELLADALNGSGLAVEAAVYRGWPEWEGAFEGVDAVVIYCDGGAKHLAEGKVEALRELRDRGVGYSFLHYALEPESEELADFMSEAIGGYFDLNWSVNPIWELKDSRLAAEKIAAGVSPIEIKDEWYYHMRFREDGDFEPILSGLPPLESLGEDGARSGNAAVRAALEAGELQHLAWRRIGEQGQRGFGFTGGHFHHNWNDADFRKLVLNAIAWTAGIDFPQTGIVSDFPNIVTYKTIEEAIARDDLQDVRVHLHRDPQLLNTPGRGGMTLLQQAVMRKKSEIALFLLQEGADPNAKTKSGQTTAHLAVTRNLPELCRALAEAGVDLGARDKQGWTALHLAAAKNQASSVRALIESGADVNALSEAGGTPLHEAAASGGEEVLSLLLEAGVDVSVVSSHGVTALDLAKEYENAAALKLLQ